MIQTLFVLPASVATAAENMALDWLLLENFPEPDSVRLRCYGWSHPAWTFGYSQKWADAHAASNHAPELIRRPTGGGLVDHRHDWTCALVIPASHPLASARACESYRMVHEALSITLAEAGVDNHLHNGCPRSDGESHMVNGFPNEGRSKSAPLQSTVAPCRGADLLRPLSSLSKAQTPPDFSICFHQPERFDLVRTDTGQKIAGAAQKRARQGLLLQGSVDKRQAGEVSNWTTFDPLFSTQLTKKLDLSPAEFHSSPWPQSVISETTARFASIEWNRRR